MCVCIRACICVCACVFDVFRVSQQISSSILFTCWYIVRPMTSKTGLIPIIYASTLGLRISLGIYRYPRILSVGVDIALFKEVFII